MWHNIVFILGSILVTVNGQSCPTSWIPFNNKCWYFSDQAIDHEIGMTWTEAESYCQQFNGHLASFETVEERDWVYDQYLVNWDQTRWWIGLTDTKSEGTFQWTDGTVYDQSVANWKPTEPSNSGKEDCVEMWVDKPLFRGQWNDNQCDKVDPFICKRDPGDFASCPVGWVMNDDKCYKIVSSEQQWHDADKDCKLQGSTLVSITSQAEQAYVQSLVAAQPNTDFWLGYSDTATPGFLQWSNPGASGPFTNFAPGQPATPLPYQGSTCVEMAAGLNYQWSTMKCSEERKYVCQRGLTGRCPYGWVLLASKCYEFIINTNRIETWTVANEICKASGAKMLKIETDDEELYVGTVLQQFQQLGFQEIWLGGSDLAKDDTFAWADGTPIVKTFWDVSMPKPTTGKEDCMNIYTGRSSSNWETSGCFYQRPFICELPEGATLPTGQVITVEGKCEDGWRHLNGFCYYMGEAEQTQTDAKQFCSQNNAMLTSIRDENELSFLVGQINDNSWIGLEYKSNTYGWSDGQPLSFQNWESNYPSTSKNPCVYMRHDGDWFDSKCDAIHLFICKKAEIPTPSSTISPPTGNPTDIEKCGGEGWFSDPDSTQCYFINALQLRSWNDARTVCQSIGGDLASINSPTEQTFLNFVTQGLPTVANLFIGAIDSNLFPNDVLDVSDGGWSWSNGSPFNFLNWNDGEPNNSNDEDCAELYLNGGWNDIACDAYRHFICEKTGNNDGVVGVDITDDDCKSNEACCFKHVGVEFGGKLDDSVLTASTEADQYFPASRGRLNTPADVIIINDNIHVGTGHGAWEPTGSDAEPWLQVDFDTHMEIKGVITQGRNGLIQYSERQWTKSYKIKYSQDPDNTGKSVVDWEWLSDGDGNPIIFPGNKDQDTQVTNLFPRPIIVRHIRCYPVEWKDRAALRIEYVGCHASCLFKIGMNSGFIADNMITASSSSGSKTPLQARAPVDTDECLASASDNGASYRGWISKTKSGITCQRWSDQSPQSHDRTPQNYPDSGLESNRCRNPDGEPGPWCYTTDPNVRWELCDVPVCPSYKPSGWSPSSTNANQYVQVQFNDFYKVSGITLYGSGTSVYVSKYALYFSDDGTNFKVYTAQNGQDHLFNGLDGIGLEFTDVLREPITTKYVRIQPRLWVGGIVMQFEVNGCYVEHRVTCSNVGTDFEDTSFALDCPSGCVEDLSSGIVYGTTTYTESSAVCPAAVHAGRVTNQHGGSVTVVKSSGLASYRGSYANGITSLDSSASHLSIEFDGSIYRCDTGWEPWKDHCYYLSPKTVFKNWHDARAECISMGADLTSIHSSGENDFHEYVVTQGDRGGDVWIGMNDLRTQNYFEWADDSTVVWTKWKRNEPNGGTERCVQMYRILGQWNDKGCESELSYMCKKEKQLLPPIPDDQIPTDEGCEAGWRAYGSSCYQTSGDEYMFIYANRICEENNAKLVSVHDDQEQAFIHALITSTIPPGLGYTAWIGLAAKTLEDGALIYTWESGEAVTYTHWDINEPDVRFSCAIPFEYKGVTYYECITFDHPARLENTPWCSITPVYNGGWINCDTGYEYGCTYMDDQTGFWQIDICGQNRYYVCEKDRIGYTQPIDSTPGTGGTCTNGWDGDATTSYCYQINEFTDAQRDQRLAWPDALDFCRAQGADLVSLHGVDETDAIARFVTGKNIYSYTYFWMGLNNIDLAEGYVWTDGSPVDYTNWNLGEPNNHQGTENCVEAQLYDSYSGWNDLNCDAARNYICKIVKGKTPLPPPTLPPPAGTEDPICGTDNDGTWIRYQPSYGADKCYIFIDAPLHGWQYAEDSCVKRGGHLVAIHSADENSFILGRSAKTSAEALWIGLRDVGGRAFYWADNSLMDFVNWAPSEPNNYYDSEGCVTISPDGGLWNDDNCGRLFGYVCEKYVGSTGGNVDPTPQSTGNCPAGFSPYGNACYITGGSNTYTWEVAREWCKNNSADLAVIGNGYEQAFLNNYLFGKGETFWLGLSDRFTGNGQFVWIDQSEVTYTNWAPGEPDGTYEGCAVINSANEGLWEDADCYGVNPFLCYMRKSDSIGLPEQTQSPIGCPDGYYSSSHEQACYKLVDDPKSWSDAQTSCKSEGNGYDLVSVNEIYDNDLLKSWLWRDVASGNSLWLGMTFTSTTDSDGVTKTTFKWSDGWPTLYTNWGPNEPNTDSVSTGSGCVLMNQDGSWAAVPDSGSSSCGTPMPYVCKQSFEPIPTTPEPPTGECDTGFFAYKENCYYVEFGSTDANTRSWYEAAYMCEERGAILTSFHSEDEVQAVVAAISGINSHNLFIGLSDNGFSGWAWKDESPADYFNWGTYEPNGQEGEECVEMYPWDGTWNDVSCFEGRGYICKKLRGSTQCNINTARRVDCGFEGIDEAYCVSRRGCCWDALYVSANVSGCFYPEGSVVGPSGVPINPTEQPVSGGGISAGAIAGIIIAVIVVIVVGIVVYFCVFSSNKSLPSMPMPSMPASWSSSSKTPSKSASTKSSGFDNPMALGDDGEFHSVA